MGTIRPTILYSLPPIGVGTAYVESFTGYISRLASRHLVTASAITIRMTGLPEPRPHPLQHGNANQLNGKAETARTWVDFLSRLTKRDDLGVTTCLPLAVMANSFCPWFS